MITLENEKILVKIGSGRGARIEQFLDKETNKDWVWKNDPFEKDRESALDMNAGFDAHWAGGWEEVFPSDAPGEFNGHKLYDHGEIWRKIWKREVQTKTSVSFSVDLETYPATVSKTFQLHETRPELVINYTIKNRSAETLPFIFKLHPAIDIEPQDKFIMPDSHMEPVALGFSRILGVEKRSSFPFGESSEGEVVAIDEVLPNDGFKREFVKIDGFFKGECGVFNRRTGKELEFTFSKEDLPYVWLFQSYGGFEGHYVAMMEPTNTGHYDLPAAYEAGKCGVLRPHEEKKLSLTIRLNSL